ncbi:MAG: hypothetical protein DLM72_01995, partial [Candidatus Nitrosopolaris wilkensis]
MSSLGEDLLASRNKPLPYLIAEIKKHQEKVAKFINKIDTQKQTSINNSKDLPKNVTIRREYIDCGKLDCQWVHGPYYYAYWKDENGKLRKKY